MVYRDDRYCLCTVYCGTICSSSISCKNVRSGIEKLLPFYFIFMHRKLVLAEVQARIEDIVPAIQDGSPDHVAAMKDTVPFPPIRGHLRAFVSALCCRLLLTSPLLFLSLIISIPLLSFVFIFLQTLIKLRLLYRIR